MQYNQLSLCAVFLLCFGVTVIQAQEATLTSGGNASGSGGSVSYSIGQVNYQMQLGQNGSVSEGIQQSFEISVITDVPQGKKIELLLKAYPNPTVNDLTLLVEESEFHGLNYQLYNLQGELLRRGEITSNQTRIPMNKLMASTYVMKVIQNNKEIKSFKVVKK